MFLLNSRKLICMNKMFLSDLRKANFLELAKTNKLKNISN